MNDRAISQAKSVHERLYLAVEVLATGKGDVRKRLETAILILVPLHTDDFPEHLRADFNWVIAQATKFEAKSDEGSLKATMTRIRNSTGEKIAKRIFGLYIEVKEILSGTSI